MTDWTRRNFLKSSAAATGAALLPKAANAAEPSAPETQAAATGQPNAAPQGAPRERLLFDFGWRFHLGNAADPDKDFGFGDSAPYVSAEFAKTGELFAPSRLKFDDSHWRALDLPHDWAVELPFVHDPVLTGHGSKPLGRAYPETSIGWYRRVFHVPAGAAGRRLSLEFDGVFRNAMVALNGDYLGRNMSGYAPFRFDITDFVEFGADNVLVVRVDATEQEGWFYEGAGIYRHVWLVKTAPLHIPQWGVVVRSALHGATAEVEVAVEVANEQDRAAPCTVAVELRDPEGRGVARRRQDLPAAAGWQVQEVVLRLPVADPQPWSPDSPALYRAVVTLESGGQISDRYEQTFGIRSIRYDPARGFFLNGRPVKVHGTCNHQDHAGVGAALPDRLQAYRIERLKEMGVNGYRTSHNPPTPELLDACDRLGMLVMDETRMFSSSREGLSQLERLIRRDRNHPSVIVWSIGNEEPLQGTARGARIAAAMKRLARRLDPTRPVTEAMNYAWGRGLSEVVDIQGFNYGKAEAIDAYHAQHPDQPTIGTEVGSTVSTRGIYENDPARGYVSAYDLNAPPWAATAEQWWPVYDSRPFLAGGFVWTGFDYRGEPTPYGWPCISSHFGIMDTCGFPKDNYYYYQAWWSGRPVLHLFPHWNWAGREGQPIAVWCYSNLERVELFVNGRSAGAQTVSRDNHVAWQVPYAPGMIEARGYRGGQLVLTARRETTGAPAAIRLRPDRARIAADGEDVSVVFAAVTDAQGRVVPYAGNQIRFHIAGGAGGETAALPGYFGRLTAGALATTGPGIAGATGRIIGVGNGDPSSHEADKGNVRRAFNGLCMAIVQATKQPGDVQLIAVSPGLEPAAVTITCAPASPRPAVP
ncbi:MAG TPA: beta-galactosidase GalA [Terriglobales bacterium]|nr:beta-galactosidase GalA [Terriglobales bacterium]